MRRLWVLGAVLLAGCVLPTAPPAERHCDDNSNTCGSQVCSRTNVCLDASDVRVVTTTWTFSGAAPSAGACNGVTQLDIEFRSPDYEDEDFGYAPVPCLAGSFALDRLPRSYDQIELSLELTNGDVVTRSAFIADDGDGTAHASIDFPAR